MRRHGTIPATIVVVMVALVAVAGGCQNTKSVQELRGGYEALEQKDYDKALLSAEAYLREHPREAGTAEALYLKGRALSGKTYSSEAAANAGMAQARAAFTQALELKPAAEVAALAHAGLANAAYWMGDYGVAEAQWTRAYELFESDDIKAWVWYRVGLSQQRQGKWEGADQTFASVQQKYAGTEAADRAKARVGVRGFYVQVASFANPSSANQTAQGLRAKGFPMGIANKSARGLHAVMAGPYRTYLDAQAARGKLAGQFKDAMIVP